MAISNNITSWWNRLSFTSNVNRMRKAIMSYLANEGVKCEIKDGSIVCEFQESYYSIDFTIHNNFAECRIGYECAGKEYAAMQLSDKTFVADKVNIQLENHAVVYAYTDSFEVRSSFFFSSKAMLLQLFVNHFNELNEAVELALDIIRNTLANNEEEESKKAQRIGFCVQNEETDEGEGKISAQKK